jgi:glyoxylate/hydroxypyruvate reductase
MRILTTFESTPEQAARLARALGGDALEPGRLGGAVIDVTRDEPRAPDPSIWRRPNIVLTQHSGGLTHDQIDRKVSRLLENRDRYRRGEPPIGIADLARGY